MKQPQLLTLQNIFDTFNKSNNLPEYSFFKEGFGIVVNMSQFLQPFIHATPTPYLLEDYRMGYIKQGYMRGNINLQEYTITAGHMVFITPGTIAEPIEISDDFLLVGMGIHSDLFHIALSGKLPNLFNGKQKHGFIAVNGQEGALIDHMFHMLYETATTLQENEEAGTAASASRPTQNTHRYHETTLHMLAAIAFFFDRVFARSHPAAPVRHNANDIFDRFIKLVNLHCKEQRQLAFYADRICLTERYLGTVIRQASGITAKEWIDKAVITQAKVMLRHTNMQTTEIADRLHFSTPSFFCKYFKRLTGCTPQNYRDEK